MTLFAREMTRADVPACLAIINHIISLGGSTAYEDPYTETALGDHYIGDAVTANVVVEGDRIVGFQSTFEVEPGVYSIGSFTDQQNPVRGAGKVVTDKTKSDCRALGGHSIIAKITSDNTGGLAFYSKMGFEDEIVIPHDHIRKNGTAVDRIIKRYVL
ncbi:GNAT family N-acetyltransferase [Pseudooctadecabacter sp.]|uniref:GNAT family N-acetyltransferase n=1 Tax=Pseudooctadecabacter sp. TaxID=1966338 RepID=UPI0035C867D1